MTRPRIRRIARAELIDATTRFQARLRLDQDPTPRLIANAMQIWLDEMTGMMLTLNLAIRNPRAALSHVSDAKVEEARQRIRRARETIELADQ